MCVSFQHDLAQKVQKLVSNLADAICSSLSHTVNRPHANNEVDNWQVTVDEVAGELKIGHW